MRLSMNPRLMALAILQLATVVSCASIPSQTTADSLLPVHFPSNQTLPALVHAPSNETETALAKRSLWVVKRVKCFWENYPVKQGTITDGMNYLNRVAGRPTLKGGDWSRVSCSYKSAIYWLNGYSSELTLDSFEEIAMGVQIVLDKCTGEDGYVSGETWFRDPANTGVWVVMVGYDPC